ncbi:hypothetical protein ACOSP7_027151 [Xanthoceras sorbifolium]
MVVTYSKGSGRNMNNRKDMGTRDRNTSSSNHVNAHRDAPSNYRGPEGITARYMKEKESSKSFDNSKGKNTSGNNKNIKVNTEMNPGRSRFKLLDDRIEDEAADTQNQKFDRAIPKTNVLTEITNLVRSNKKTAARHLNK